MRSAPPIAPGMPRKNASPAIAGLLRRRARPSRRARRCRRGCGRRPRPSTSPKPRPSRITTPGTPPSRTIRLEPSPITVTGISAGRSRQEIGEIGLVLGHEQHLRRPADAEPGQLGERLVGQQPAAQLRQARFQLGDQIGERHDVTDARSSTPAPRPRIAVMTTLKRRPERGQLARQRIGPLRDVAGAEAHHDSRRACARPRDHAGEILRAVERDDLAMAVRAQARDQASRGRRPRSAPRRPHRHGRRSRCRRR